MLLCELLQLLYYSFSSLCNFDPICKVVIYFPLVLNFATVICVLSKKRQIIKKKKKKINGVYDSNCHQDALNDLVVFAMFKTFSLVLYSVDDTLNILLYAPTSKASNLPSTFWSESMFHNHIIMLTIYNTAILFPCLNISTVKFRK